MANESPDHLLERTPRAQWDAAHGSAAASYQQDWAYGVALKAASPTVEILRAAIARPDGSVLALAQIVARPFALIGRFALCTHGPAWVGAVMQDEKREAYRLLRKSLPQGWPRMLVFTPDESAGEPAGLNGMSRVMTGDATVLIDLTKDEAALRSAFESSWRNKLSKAERSDLVLQKSGLKPAQYRWLLDAETQQRQKRGYRAMPSNSRNAGRTRRPKALMVIAAQAWPSSVQTWAAMLPPACCS